MTKILSEKEKGEWQSVKLPKKSRKKTKVVPYTVINNDLYVLLCKESWNTPENRNKYSMIGGSCESGETIVESAARELFEETIGIFDKSVEQYLKTLPAKNIVTFVKDEIEYFIFFLPIKLENKKKYNPGKETKIYKDIVKIFEDFTNLFSEKKNTLNSIINKKYPKENNKIIIPNESKEIAKTLINSEREAKKISITYLRKFNELNSLKWIKFNEMIDENTFTFSEYFKTVVDTNNKYLTFHNYSKCLSEIIDKFCPCFTETFGIIMKG
jgi:ADP-ribose pyrophosphatase YjhB (NUDIX family)